MTDQKLPDAVLKALGEPFPRAAVKSRTGAGNKQFRYVEAETVIRRLNSATNGCWDFRIVSIDWRGDVMLCQGELTIPGLGTRTGFGVQKVAPNSGEDLLKAASSDALKKSATLFGVGLELYPGSDYEADMTPTPQAPATIRRAPQDAPQPPIDRGKVMQRLHSYVPHDALHNWAVSMKCESVSDIPIEALIDLGKSFRAGGATAFMATHAPAAGQSSIEGLDDLHAQLDRERAAERARA